MMQATGLAPVPCVLLQNWTNCHCIYNESQ